MIALGDHRSVETIRRALYKHTTGEGPVPGEMRVIATIMNMEWDNFQWLLEQARTMEWDAKRGKMKPDIFS